MNSNFDFLLDNGRTLKTEAALQVAQAFLAENNPESCRQWLLRLRTCILPDMKEGEAAVMIGDAGETFPVSLVAGDLNLLNNGLIYRPDRGGSGTGLFLVRQIMTRILIVEDEQIIRELLGDNLEFEGFSTTQTANLSDAETFMKSEKPDMVLLDLNLPDGNGSDRLKQWRQNGLVIPVIICTIRDREIDIIKALDAGAVDIKKEYAPTLDIARNKWVLLPIYDGKESMFLELQVSAHVE